MGIPKLLSKTKLMRGYRCHKSIYLTIHNPSLEAPISEDTQALFDQGNLIGEEARKRFPGGALIDNKPWDFVGSLKKTRELLSNGTETIYEAAFEHKGCYARADIIQYSKDTKRWKIFEVKSSTKVKDEQIDDIGLQAWIIANSGLPIEQISILHLNPECRFPNLDDLFVSADLTEQLRALYPKILPRVSEIFSVIQSSKAPDIDIGSHCSTPNDCGFMEHCWSQKKIPEVSVFNLPQIRAKKWEYYSQGIMSLDDPRLTELSPIQKRVVDAFKSGERIIEKGGIKSAIESWEFPLVFLDFETINPAIPRFKGCTPFSHVPFQFSVHVWPSPNDELVHLEFLHDSKSDPRPDLIPALIKACGDSGSIVAYYGRFESDRISELAEFSSENKDALNLLVSRIVDPLPIFREHVYDNKFGGSFSLKAVAPAILGDAHSYDGMPVANGTAAQRAYEEMISDSTSSARKSELRRAMLDYCQKDTLVMVELVKWLFREVGE